MDFAQMQKENLHKVIGCNNHITERQKPFKKDRSILNDLAVGWYVGDAPAYFSRAKNKPSLPTFTAPSYPLRTVPCDFPLDSVHRAFSTKAQTKLVISHEGDDSELEADRIASEKVGELDTMRTQPLRQKPVEAAHVVEAHPLQIQRQVIPTSVKLAEAKTFGHEDLQNTELKEKWRTYIGSTTLMQLTPPGNYKGHCVKEYLAEVANTCPSRFAQLRLGGFCTESKCLDVGRWGTAGDASTGKVVTDSQDSFIDRHRTHNPQSLLEGTGKDVCSIVCHQRYKFDRRIDVGSFYIIRNFRASKYKIPKTGAVVHITTGAVQKVVAPLEAPSKEDFAKSGAPELAKKGLLTEKLQRKAIKSSKSTVNSAAVKEALNVPGRPIDNKTLSFMESRFGCDFSQVRIHKGEHAAKSAASVNALAFTVGNNIFFGSGQYRPQTTKGLLLLAHELVHVIQQHGILRRQAARTSVDAETKWDQLPSDAQIVLDYSFITRNSNEWMWQGHATAEACFNNVSIDRILAFLGVYNALKQQNLWSWIERVSDVYPRPVQGIKFKPDDRESLARALSGSTQFCRDTWSGKSSPKWRQVVPLGTSGLHITLPTTGISDAHLDTIAPVKGRYPSGECNISYGWTGIRHFYREKLGW